jgi:putative glycosyltransferase (TIGR04372 family)
MYLIEFLINKLLWPDSLVDGVKDYDALRYLKNHKKSKATIIAFIRIIIRILCTCLMFPIAGILYLLNYRVIYGCKLKQIGDICFLDCQIKYDRLLKKKYKYISFFSKNIHDNSYIVRLYNKEVIFIESLIMKILISPIMNNKLLWVDLRRLDATVTIQKYNRIQSMYYKRYKKSIISMPNEDIQDCKLKFLNMTGNNISKFISVHIRTTSFDQGHSRITRCADANTYIDAISFLLSRGFNVIRIGDAGMPKIHQLRGNENYFDAIGLKDNKFDIFCLSQCYFHLGSASGPSDIPGLFGINCVTTNIYPPFNGLRNIEGDLCIFKKIVDYRGFSKNLELLDTTINLSTSYERDLNIHGLAIKDNTPEEILNVVKDFVYGISKSQNNKNSLKVKKMIKSKYRDYKSIGNYSELFISKFLNSRDL